MIIFILYNHIVKQIAKLAMNGFCEKAMLYIYWYLRYCKDCALMNKTRRKFEAIISGVPQGSLLGLIFLIFSLNSIFFYFLFFPSIYNFVGGNNLSVFANKILQLNETLQAYLEIVIKFFKKNQMIIKPDIFKLFIKNLQICSQSIKRSESIKHL